AWGRRRAQSRGGRPTGRAGLGTGAGPGPGPAEGAAVHAAGAAGPQRLADARRPGPVLPPQHGHLSPTTAGGVDRPAPVGRPGPAGARPRAHGRRCTAGLGLLTVRRPAARRRLRGAYGLEVDAATTGPAAGRHAAYSPIALAMIIFMTSDVPP